MRYVISNEAYLRVVSFLERELTAYTLDNYDDYIDRPFEYRSYKYNVVATIFYCLLQELISSKVSRKNAETILEVTYAYRTKSILNGAVLNSCCTLAKELCSSHIESMIDVEELYENVIATDFTLTEGQMRARILHGGRNVQAAFFTPQNLADNCVELLFIYHVESQLGINIQDLKDADDQKVAVARKKICTLRVADISCGIGRFLISYLKTLKKFLLNIGVSIIDVQHDLFEASKHVYGVDIDFLALDIALLSVADNVSAIDKVWEIQGNWILGNPLLSLESESTIKQKTNAFKSGIYYSNDLAINIFDCLPQLDLVIGNPPWEKIRLEEKSFFVEYAPEILQKHNKKDRENWINSLKLSHPELFDYYQVARSSYETSKKQIKDSRLFEYSSSGELNTYSLFTELADRLVYPSGSIGLLVKTGLLTTAVNKNIFNRMVDQRRLAVVADFVNKRKIFQIDGRERFCFLVTSENKVDYFKYAGLLLEADDVIKGDYWNFPYVALKELNPKNGMLPSVSGPTELSFLRKVYSTCSTFDDVFSSANYGRLVHYTNHARDIYKLPSNDLVPIIEGKFLGQYDGRFSTYEGMDFDNIYSAKARARLISSEEKNDSYFRPESRFFICGERWKKLTKNYSNKYSLMWRSLSSASNSRTCIGTILPHQPASQSVQFLQLESNSDLILALALMNSTVFDYIVRKKMSGIDVTQTLIKQIAVPKRNSFADPLYFLDKKTSPLELIMGGVEKLLRADARLYEFCKLFDSGNNLEVNGTGIELIDAVIARCYDLSLKEYRFILSSFNLAWDKNKALDNFTMLQRL